MANENVSALTGWRKILATTLMIGIPAINSSIVGINLTMPDDYEVTTLIVWGIKILVEMTPTIATLIGGSKYISANKEQNIAAIESEAVVATAAITPTASPAIVEQPRVVETAPYTPIDIKAMVQAAEKSVQDTGIKVDASNRASFFWPYVANFDLRDIPRQHRISESIAMISKALELFSDSFKFQTKLNTVPTQEESNNLNVYMLKLKHEYEAANNLQCSDQTFDNLRGIVGYFNEIYAAKFGLEQLVGKTVDWSIYGGGAFTPTQVGWDYAKLI